MIHFNWRTILHIHLYLGLLCMPYLIIFSLSSLNFNHHFLPETPLKAKKNWSTQLMLLPREEVDSYADEVMDSLAIFGWFLPWDSYQDSQHIHLAISQPGMQYHIDINKQTGYAEVVENTQSITHIVKLLHFLGETIPNAPWWVNAWQHYQSLTVYAMLFWTITGVYLWARKKNTASSESGLLWGLSILSLILIVGIWLVG